MIPKHGQIIKITSYNVDTQLLALLAFSPVKMLQDRLSNRKAMNRNWCNQKANPALKTKTDTDR